MNLDPQKAQIRPQLFGGKGSVATWNCLPKSATGPFTAALWCTLEPGGSVGSHHQPSDAEIVLCIDGEGEISVGNNTHTFQRGELVYVPVGESLSIHNRCDKQGLHYAIIKARVHNG